MKVTEDVLYREGRKKYKTTEKFENWIDDLFMRENTWIEPQAENYVVIIAKKYLADVIWDRTDKPADCCPGYISVMALTRGATMKGLKRVALLMV